MRDHGDKRSNLRRGIPACGRAALLAGCALGAMAMLFPSAAWAVECSNGGAGPNPAGNDGGVAANTACGNAADASGAASENTAAGNLATALGAGSFNTRPALA
jgi:hypothetical protein